MKTTVTLLRGADTIGGSCIKISHGSDVIILDYGMPLMAAGGEELPRDLSAKPTLENGMLISPTAIGETLHGYVISHAHPDHYGLINYLDDSADVYLSDSSLALLTTTNVFYPKALQVNNLERCHSFTPGKMFSLGPFMIQAYLMDHSAFGACGLHVIVGGKSIFYTGDFRGHGRKPQVLDYACKHIGKVDVLLMEGTTLDNGHPNTFKTEPCVEHALVDIMQENAHLFVAASGSNVDRLVSLYNACKRSGRILVLDIYQVSLLEALKVYAPGLPPHASDCIRVYFPKNQSAAFNKAYGEGAVLKYKHLHINADKLMEGERYVFRLSNFYLMHLLKAVKERGHNAQLVYSMWLGYKDKQAIFKELENVAQSQWQYIHTSGHAYLDDLKRMAEGLSPEALIP
ncbi:MAG: hypothetical protein KAG18_05795, partial [Sinobacterium sp.]|nr:hypothetical protein [Sinobacterium sp.]